MVDLRIFIQSTINKSRLFICDLFLATDFLGTECAYEVGYDLASNPQVEDGKGVVERVVLRSCCIVEYNRSRQATDVQSVEE